ncbi:MAG: hypothetical protein R6U98_11730 [Pirellulaceae bacterium]
MRNGLDNLLEEPLAEFDHTLLVARGAEVSALAGEGQEVPVAAAAEARLIKFLYGAIESGGKTITPGKIAKFESVALAGSVQDFSYIDHRRNGRRSVVRGTQFQSKIWDFSDFPLLDFRALFRRSPQTTCSAIPVQQRCGSCKKVVHAS